MIVLSSGTLDMFNAYFPLVIGASFKVKSSFKLALGFTEAHAIKTSSSSTLLLCWWFYHNGSCNKWLKSFPWLREMTGLILNHNEEMSQKYHVYLIFGLWRETISVNRSAFLTSSVFSLNHISMCPHGALYFNKSLCFPHLSTPLLFIFSINSTLSCNSSSMPHSF